ncbi:MAG: DUF4965 domain-containing protein [Oscillospiraceae bacterium]|nr:DUF4965 domain-containing protein [Oscillospiraceae bacterium]
MTTKPFRAPAYPLITMDPYTSIWSMQDVLTDGPTRHWTGRPNSIVGTVTIDDVPYRFLGKENGEEDVPVLAQQSVSFDSFTTTYVFAGAGVELTAAFTSPLLPTDLHLLSRPVSYLRLSARSLDRAKEDTAPAVTATVRVSSLCCLDREELPVLRETLALDQGLTAIRMGSEAQPVLGKAGDGVCIDWGYFYLAGAGKTEACTIGNRPGISIRADVPLEEDVWILFGYDDVFSLSYFGQPLPAYWKKDGATIGQVLAEAWADRAEVLARCADFDRSMTDEAAAAGGMEYAQLLQLALRQVCAAHKLVLDPDGEILYISKECFSNGCAATADVSYPSVPLFLLYQPELVRGMLRPIFQYAESPAWPFDFAPHDAGTYPILHGQVYSDGTDPKNQMPVEECGNLLIMTAAADRAFGGSLSGDAPAACFAAAHRETLRTWADYLLAHGVDPEEQLCTDDFAGHLAHNCNLSLKAVMGLMAYVLLCKDWGAADEAERFHTAAKDMAQTWLRTAANEDGSFRLAFDQPGTFSMKYNAIWDLVWGTGLFPAEAMTAETNSYLAHCNAYGLPLDNRADYTKSDWLVWAASLAGTRAAFERLTAPLFRAYRESAARVPLTDWYSTVTAKQIGFQHRSVQGGLWMRMLAARAAKERREA